MASGGGSKVWSLMSLGSSVGAAIAARKALEASWKTAARRKSPANPADPDVDVWEAVTWALATGAVASLARMLAQRRAAEYYTRSTGHLPPPLQKDGQ